MTCLTPGCSRARIPEEHGIVHAHCAACESRLLREAFGPVSWHDRARVSELPPLVVGGTPLTSSGPVPGVEALSPQGPGHPQSAGAPVTSGPDRPLSVVPSPPSPGVGSRGAEPAAMATTGG